MHSLPNGLIFEIARLAGIHVPEDREKASIRCPLHDDQHPSAFLSGTRNLFHCSVCALTLTAKAFCERLDIQWKRFSPRYSAPPVQGSTSKSASDRPAASFTPVDAARAFDAALARSRLRLKADGPVYHYLKARRLLASWNEAAFGVVHPELPLSSELRRWASSGYRLLAPLFDKVGRIANVQLRSINGREPKTLFPSGSHAQGTVFATELGRRLLRGESSNDRRVLYGEGLTDHLAYSISCPYPTIAAPGVDMYSAGIGPWVRDRIVILASDSDESGERVIDATHRAAHRLGAARVIRLRWPSLAKDACDVLERYGAASLREILESVKRGES